MTIDGKCAQCGKSSDNLRRCTGKCGGKAAYCSKECQQQHWAGHKSRDRCGKITKDHTFHPLDGTTFMDEMARFLVNCDRKDKVPLCYKANVCIKDGDDVAFERIRLLPKAAIEHAKTDSDFGYHLCLSVALSYKEQILAKCGDGVRCAECSQPATTIFQAPMVDWDGKNFGSLDPIVTIRDIWARPCCERNGATCLKKVKDDFATYADNLAQMQQQRK